MADITVGEARQLRGHWTDRLADIDADIDALGVKLGSAKPAQAGGAIARAIAEVLGRPRRPAVAAHLTPPASFQPGSPVTVEFGAEKDYPSVRLFYCRVNQAERWQSEPMQSDGRLWRAAIPSDYTQSPYPLQYYVELKEAPDSTALYPGLGAQLIGQPYYVIRSRG